MDVFSKYFRRLLLGNAAQIFPSHAANTAAGGAAATTPTTAAAATAAAATSAPGATPSANTTTTTSSKPPAENAAGNYALLVQEMRKVGAGATDLEQAHKIADTIDAAVAAHEAAAGTAASSHTNTSTASTATASTSTPTDPPTASAATASVPSQPAGAAAATNAAAAATAAQLGGQAAADVFRDFDLRAFVEHFSLDPIPKVALLLAFKCVSSQSLRRKADDMLRASKAQFEASLSTVTEYNKDFTPAFIAAVLERLVLDPLDDLAAFQLKEELHACLEARYADPIHITAGNGNAMPLSPSQLSYIPTELENALQMVALSSQPAAALARRIQMKGPKAMQTQESIAEMIKATAGPEGSLDVAQIALGLYYITVTPAWRQYSPQLYLTTVSKLGSGKFDWSRLPRAFDQPRMAINADQFVRLVNSLLAVSRDSSSGASAMDVQNLWGGIWENGDAQRSFLTAFCSSSIDVTTIPNFRAAFSLANLDSAAPAPVLARAATAEKSPWRSVDAAKAIFDLVLRSSQTVGSPDAQQFVTQLLHPNLSTFIMSIFAFPQPWNQVQLNFVLRSIAVLVSTRPEGYQLALYYSWTSDRGIVTDAIHQLYQSNPGTAKLIYEVATELSWLEDLVVGVTPLSFELACLAHRSDAAFDLDKWLREAVKQQTSLGEVLIKTLKIKAEDELAFQRKESAIHCLTPLSVKTVYAILCFLEDTMGDSKPLHDIQRICIQTYPRLINYGDGLDDVIEANSAHGNGLPDQVEKQMQELFGKMYHEELSLRQVLEIMRRYKASRDPHEQDLFTCMVHGLIDEYNCYPEYPIEALSKAAVLFGGLINFRLVSGITLQVCLSLILESVRGRSIDDFMFKFGVEAIEQILERLQEWPRFCSQLLQIPLLAGTPIFAKASEVVSERGRSQTDTATSEGQNGSHDDGTSANGSPASEQAAAQPVQSRWFRAIHVDPPSHQELFREPEEEVHDKILFILNNVSEQNIDDKLKDLKEVLLEEHYQWFASYLVDQRAKLQPNFQQLYLTLLERINNKLLWAEVLRETFITAFRLLSSAQALTNSIERKHLKSIASWLGLLTLARDKPIKHRNIYFKDLLLEAFDTDRLYAAVPFTCKVLVEARKSTVFKPPNPWSMEILSLLTELYNLENLKLILKFEIEVCCKDLKLDPKDIEPSTCITQRPPSHLEESVSATATATASLPEELHGFEDLSMVMNGHAQRMSPTTMLQGLPSLEQVLVLPAAAAGVMDPVILRTIVLNAIERAITEIIAPVVERSITIASISAAQLINKDFALEPDEEKYRSAALNMVRSLAGSLALVTCKEPLKMSMMNYMKVFQQEYPEQPMPETLIMMCVNENLDNACGIVEMAAEEKAVPEMEKIIEQALEVRRVHRATAPHEPFVDANISRWAFFIPEPYRQVVGGLNAEQLATYEVFARHHRAAAAAAAAATAGHVPQMSADSMEAMPEMVPDAYAAASLQTPGQMAAVPQIVPVEALQHQLAGAAQPNGYASPAMIANPQGKLEQHIRRLQESARTAGVDNIKDLAKDTPILQDYHAVIKALYALPNADHFARFTAQVICVALHEPAVTTLESQILVHLLSRICELAPVITKDTRTHLSFQNDTHLFSVPTLVALNEVGLLEFALVDVVAARMLFAHNVEALAIIAGLLETVLLSDEPIALRSDFAATLEALGHWAAEEPQLTVLSDLMKKLRDVGIPSVVEPLLSDKARAQRDQMEYVFSEWLGLYKSSIPGEGKYLLFLRDLHESHIMQDPEGSALFLRVAIDLSVAMFEHICQTSRANLDEAFLAVDALAKLMVLLVKYRASQHQEQDDQHNDKVQYLRSMHSLVVLVMNHHQIVRGVAFNQRVFFRLLSSILCEYQLSNMVQCPEHAQMMLVFGEQFLALQPIYMPAFTFGWVSLISHRAFMASILELPDKRGWPVYCEIIQVLLLYTGKQLKAALSWASRELYNGVLRILLILHHDFPEFILEHHHNFCSVIPAYCSQLRNLILSAYPSDFPKLPDPFREGLKMDALEECRYPPQVAGDISAPLEQAGVKAAVDQCLKSGATDQAVQQICAAVMRPPGKQAAAYRLSASVDVYLLNVLMLYIATNAVDAANRSGSASDSATSASTPGRAHATGLLERLSKALNFEGRCHLLSAVANQLRFPNSHTNYFSFFLVHHFKSASADEQGLDIREQVVRVLLERLIVHRPHPWGLIITLQELVRNKSYNFFELPFIQQNPEVGRLFDALLSHIQQQSPRVD